VISLLWVAQASACDFLLNHRLKPVPLFQPLLCLHPCTADVFSATPAPILTGTPLPSTKSVDPSGCNTACIPHLSQWCRDGGSSGCQSSTK